MRDRGRARMLDWRDLAGGRDEHRPANRDALAREARRLSATGLTPRDVGAALRLSEHAVLDLLDAASNPSPGEYVSTGSDRRPR